MRPEDLDLKKLYTFKLVAERGSLRSAATILRLTVPAVSFQIRRLEEELGVPLFLRQVNRLELTKYGDRLRSDSDHIFQVVSKTLSRIGSETRREHVSISTSNDIEWYFAPLVASVMRSRPDVDISHHVLTSSEALGRLRRGDLDMCLGFHPKAPKGLRRQPILSTGFTFAVSGSSRVKPSLSNLSDRTLILLPKQSSTRKLLDRFFLSVRISPKRIVEAGTCEMACRIAAQNGGIAVIHAHCASRYSGENLRFTPAGNLLPEIEYSAFTRRDPTKQSLTQELVKAVIQAHADTRSSRNRSTSL
jgi:DNA-binding transcriptional LysR family regulator